MRRFGERRLRPSAARQGGEVALESRRLSKFVKNPSQRNQQPFEVVLADEQWLGSS
jgi:hypothetical protein